MFDRCMKIWDLSRNYMRANHWHQPVIQKLSVELHYNEQLQSPEVFTKVLIEAADEFAKQGKEDRFN